MAAVARLASLVGTVLAALAVFAAAALAAGVGFLQAAPYRWALLPVLALYVVLPRVRAGTAGHAALASCAMIFYATGLVSLL